MSRCRHLGVYVTPRQFLTQYWNLIVTPCHSAGTSGSRHFLSRYCAQVMYVRQYHWSQWLGLSRVRMSRHFLSRCALQVPYVTPHHWSKKVVINLNVTSLSSRHISGSNRVVISHNGLVTLSTAPLKSRTSHHSRADTSHVTS